jgi:UDP-N-acetylglucosamine 2-epimerase (non-hydrolysing)
VTGNTVIDALLWMRRRQQEATADGVSRARQRGVPAPMAEAYFGVNPSRWILVTGHRRESFGGGFENICRAIRAVADQHPDVGIIYPVHLNPNVQAPVRRLLSGHPRIALIDPLAYEDFVWFMDRAHFILSDSGGVQEEAPSLGKPVLVMRTTTERPEGVTAGTSRLVGTDPAAILRESATLLNDPKEYAARSRLRNPYGDGSSAGRILAVLERGLT